MLEIKSVKPASGMYTALWTFNGVQWSGVVYECPNCGQQMMYSQGGHEEPEAWKSIDLQGDFTRCEFVGYIESEKVCPHVTCCNCFMKHQEWVESTKEARE